MWTLLHVNDLLKKEKKNQTNMKDDGVEWP